MIGGGYNRQAISKETGWGGSSRTQKKKTWPLEGGRGNTYKAGKNSGAEGNLGQKEKDERGGGLLGGRECVNSKRSDQIEHGKKGR